jgi:hypothetical protein
MRRMPFQRRAFPLRKRLRALVRVNSLDKGGRGRLFYVNLVRRAADVEPEVTPDTGPALD